MDEICADLLKFLHESPTPYHAVQSALARLEGFTVLDEGISWSDLAPGRYAVVRGGALVAFVLPPGRARSFRIVGAHTDSPNLRLKSRPEFTRVGYHQVGVEVYGGALLNSWLDRDLGIAGRVVVRGEQGLTARLMRVDQPIARVPQLAVHLDREVNDRGLVLNRQEHLSPVLGLTGSDAPSALRALCAQQVGAQPDQLLSFDLMLHDLTAPSLGGLSGEFIFSARLDNLAMCHAGIQALLRAAHDTKEGDPVPLVALFDHEEVGSNSATGAGAPILPMILERLVLATGGGRDDYLASLSRSLCVSADMAHAVHPNYPERHDARHRPALNAGPVIKINSQQRYATCGRTASLFDELCRRVGVQAQYYVHRTDLPCGSTIGPITATLLGIPTVDVGNPMLSMHSAREMAGSGDPAAMARVLAAFLADDGALWRLQKPGNLARYRFVPRPNAVSNDLFEKELASLLESDLSPPPPRGEARERLLSRLAWLERFSPLSPIVARALSVEPRQARLAMHALSEPAGWLSIEMLGDLKIRPVRVPSKGGEREIDGAIFAQVDPGGRIPRHLHHGPEVMVILQGCLGDEDDPSRPLWIAGSQIDSLDGTEHALRVPLAPAEACLCLVVNQGWAEYLLATPTRRAFPGRRQAAGGTGNPGGLAAAAVALGLMLAARRRQARC